MLTPSLARRIRDDIPSGETRTSINRAVRATVQMDWQPVSKAPHLIRLFLQCGRTSRGRGVGENPDALEGRGDGVGHAGAGAVLNECRVFDEGAFAACAGEKLGEDDADSLAVFEGGGLGASEGEGEGEEGGCELHFESWEGVEG